MCGVGASSVLQRARERKGLTDRVRDMSHVGTLNHKSG